MSADDLPAEVLNNGPRQPGVGMAVRKRRWPWIALTAVVLTVAAVGISGFLVSGGRIIISKLRAAFLANA